MILEANSPCWQRPIWAVRSAAAIGRRGSCATSRTSLLPGIGLHPLVLSFDFVWKGRPSRAAEQNTNQSHPDPDLQTWPSSKDWLQKPMVVQ
jgi:hypothetical protein